MEKEENVCVDERTANAAEAEKRECEALGKFKDVNALLEAYGALEAEFTRRSQRLKALEREAENFKVERKKDEQRKEQAEKSVKTEPSDCAQQQAEKPAFASEPSENFGETALVTGAETPETVSEETRQRIVREYLQSLHQGGVPLSKGGGTLGVSAVKARNIGEASAMALRFFKNNQNQ